MESQNNNLPPETDANDECLSPKELVNRHLQNKEHKISDEDLQKVELDCNDNNANALSTLATAEVTNNMVINDRINDNDQEDGKDEDEEPKDRIITPLDVIS